MNSWDIVRTEHDPHGGPDIVHFADGFRQPIRPTITVIPDRRVVDNQHKMIQGYRDLSQTEIDSINDIKQAELAIGELWRNIKESEHPDIRDSAPDARWMSIAKTHFEEGFSAFVRAVAKPEPRF